MSVPPVENAPATVRPFCFMVAVWGASYCQTFVDLCLPSLLAPDNLPRLDAAAGHRFLIATTKQDWQRIEHLPVMERLRRHVTPTLIEIATPDTPGYAGVLRHQRQCFKQLLDAAYSYRSYGCLLSPDVILSDGLVAAMLRAVQEGDQLLLLAAMRQTEETLLAELAARGIIAKDRPLSLSAEPLVIPPRLAAELAVRHLHPEMEVFAEGQRQQRAQPAFRFWRLANGRGLILHTFYAPPMLLDFAAVPADHTACLEHDDFETDYYGQAFGRDVKLRVIADSDECGILSLTPAGVDHTQDWGVFKRAGGRLMPELALLSDLRNSMAAYVRRSHDVVRRDLFRQSVRWHADDIDAMWLHEEARIDGLITRAAGDYYADPSRFPTRFGRDPRYWLLDLFALLQHLGRYRYYLTLLLAALAGDANMRLLVRRKLSQLTRYFGLRKR